jgi:hypothetical protein
VTLWMVPSARAIWYVRALRSILAGQGKKPSGAGRGHAV